MSSKALKAARTLILAGLAAAFAATTAEAQTAEGDTIRNIATATFTDANSNTYAAVADTVDIIVGFQAGISVTPDAGTASPPSPSTALTMAFTVENIGNGVDTVQVAEDLGLTPAMFDSVGYNWNSTDYTTLAALNTALASFELTAGATTTINVVYKIAAAQGGESTIYQLTATSVRDAGESDPGQYTLTAGETYGVTVVEQDSGLDTTTANLLPGNGQTVVFEVTNTGNGTEDFDLLTTQIPGTMLSVTAMAGALVSQGGDPDSARITGLGPSTTTTVTVTFNVADLAAGTVDSLFILVRSVAQPATNAEGAYIVTLVKPALTILKEAFTDAGLSTPVSGDVFPGQSIWYKITVSNAAGTAAAQTIDIDDDLPTQVTYAGSGDDGNPNWTISGTGGPPWTHIDAQLTTLAAGASAYFWIQVTIN